MDDLSPPDQEFDIDTPIFKCRLSHYYHSWLLRIIIEEGRAVFTEEIAIEGIKCTAYSEWYNPDLNEGDNLEQRTLAFSSHGTIQGILLTAEFDDQIYTLIFKSYDNGRKLEISLSEDEYYEIRDNVNFQALFAPAPAPENVAVAPNAPYEPAPENVAVAPNAPYEPAPENVAVAPNANAPYEPIMPLPENPAVAPNANAPHEPIDLAPPTPEPESRRRRSTRKRKQQRRRKGSRRH